MASLIRRVGIAALAAATLSVLACSHPRRSASATALRPSDLPAGYAQTAAITVDLADEAPAQLGSALRSAKPWTAFKEEFEALPPAPRTRITVLSFLSGTGQGAADLFAARQELAAAVGFGGGIPSRESPTSLGDEASELSAENPNGDQMRAVIWRDGIRVGLVGVGGHGTDVNALATQLARALDRRFRSG